MGSELETVEPAVAVTLFRTDEPAETIERATEVATHLAKVIKDRGLTAPKPIERHVRIEGWTLLGTMLGVFPYLVWSRPIEGGFEARVEARTKAGELVGAAEAQCTRTEKTWASRDDYALRSMAQTRATSKALRQPLGFVMALAGYEATPAEEMTNQPAGVFQAPTPKPDVSPGLSKAQQGKIYKLIDKLKADERAGLTDEAVTLALDQHYRKQHIMELTSQEASDLIGRLETKEKDLERGIIR